MIRWSRNNIKHLNSPPNKNLNASQPRIYEEPRSQSPTPNPFKVPAPSRHPNRHAGFTHKPGKHSRDFDSHPTRPRKRRRRVSRIDWAAREARAQVCTHFRTFIVFFSFFPSFVYVVWATFPSLSVGLSLSHVFKLVLFRC